MLLSSILYGLAPVLGKIIFTEINPLSVAFFRNLLASLVFLLFLTIKKEFSIFKSIKRRDLLILCLIGIFAFSGFQIFYLVGIDMTTASIGSLLANTNKIFFILFAFTFLKSPLTKRKILGILLAMLGVFFIIWNGGFEAISLDIPFLIGCLLLIAAAIFCGIFYTANENYVDRYNSNPILLIVFLFSLIIITPLAIPEIPLILNASSNIIILLIIVGIFCTGFSALTFSESLKYLAPPIASSISLTTPLFAMFFAVIIIAEVLTLYVILGAILILAGNFLTISEKE